MFVNGPSGRVASYLYNRDDLLHYFLTDHLGSTRVLVHAPSGSLPRVHQYMNYHPFGEVLEEYGSYNTNFKYTGKEHDRHSSFDYVYFGARYYKPQLGQFATIDKASQFASGYVYGMNNPLIGVDPDGNLFLGLAWFVIQAAISVAPAAATGALTSMATYTAFNLDKDWTWKGMLNAGAAGAAGGATGSAIGQVANVTSKVLGGTGASGVRGVFGTAVGAGVSNMGISLARGATFEQSLGFGVSGFATGAVGGSGAFGLAKKGMFGRLGYQALTTTVHSVGDNIAAGSEKPFDNITVGLGPVTFRLGEDQR